MRVSDVLPIFELALSSVGAFAFIPEVLLRAYRRRHLTVVRFELNDVAWESITPTRRLRAIERGEAELFEPNTTDVLLWDVVLRAFPKVKLERAFLELSDERGMEILSSSIRIGRIDDGAFLEPLKKWGIGRLVARRQLLEATEVKRLRRRIVMRGSDDEAILAEIDAVQPRLGTYSK